MFYHSLILMLCSITHFNAMFYPTVILMLCPIPWKHSPLSVLGPSDTGEPQGKFVVTMFINQTKMTIF